MGYGFSGTFQLELDTLASYLRLLLEEQDYTTQELSAQLGIGKRKVDGVKGWSKVLEVVEGNTVSELGKFLLEFDPYFDTLEVKSLFHFHLSVNEDAYVWNRLINFYLRPYVNFSRENTKEFIFQNYEVTSEKHLNSDLSNFLRMYTQSKPNIFYELNYLTEEDGTYYLTNFSDIPYSVFGYALYYCKSIQSNESTTSLERLSFAPNYPGKIFGLNSETINKKLGLLQNDGAISVVKSADIDGVSYRQDYQPLDLLKKYFK